MYTYVGNDPVDRTDPSGNYVLVDDLIFGGTGAALGVASEYVGGEISSAFGGPTPKWQDYVAAGAGGWAGGEAALYTLESGAGAIAAAGAATGATTNLVDQGLHKITDTPNASFDTTGFAVDTGIGAGTALVPGLKLAGVNRPKLHARRGQTDGAQARAGQIRSVSAKTAAKMAGATATEQSGSVAAATTWAGGIAKAAAGQNPQPQHGGGLAMCVPVRGLWRLQQLKAKYISRRSTALRWLSDSENRF